MEQVKQTVCGITNKYNVKSAEDITDLEKQIVEGNYIDNIIKLHREKDKTLIILPLLGRI